MALKTEERALEMADVGAQRIAHVYAEALLNSAEKRQLGLEILEELQALVRDVFDRDPHFEAFLQSGAIGRDRKTSALHKALEGRSSELLFDFLHVLNRHDRLALIRPMVAAYQHLVNERGGRIRVQVRTAVPLPDDQREQLRNQLRQSLQKEPMLEPSIDPDLIGGVILQVGDWLYDASVRTQLEQLRKKILERSSHEIQSGRDRFSSPVGD